MTNFKTIEIEDVLNEQQLVELANLEIEVFPTSPMPIEKLAHEFNNHSKWLSLLVYDNDKMIAYKIGYERSRENFYSWIGGIDPEFRRMGIARELMDRQHLQG